MVSSIMCESIWAPLAPLFLSLSLSLHCTLCQGSSETTEGDISLSSSQAGLEWDSAIALYGHIPALAADYGHRRKMVWEGRQQN